MIEQKMRKEVTVKPMHKSLTLQGVGVTFGGAIALVLANLTPISNCAEELGRKDIADAVRGIAPIIVLLGGGASTVGALRKGIYYTPPGVAGPTRHEGSGS